MDTMEVHTIIMDIEVIMAIFIVMIITGIHTIDIGILGTLTKEEDIHLTHITEEMQIEML